MKLVFSGLEHVVELARGHASVLEVENRALFARICQALFSEKEEDAVEPYSLWDDGDERMRAKDVFLMVCDPFNLPWKDKSLVKGLYEGIANDLIMDEDIRAEVSELQLALSSAVMEFALQRKAEYRFALEWDMNTYLKCFGFGIGAIEGASLLDNLIRFVEYVADTSPHTVVVFCNLKLFLTENDLRALYDTAVFHEIALLLLENVTDDQYYACERKLTVEQGFLEYKTIPRSECLSSSQGGICSNGFGAVAF